MPIPPAVSSVLREARQVYVALVTGDGPHVTPELYSWSDDRLWFAAATSTLKARAVDDGDRIAAAVVGRGSVVTVEGLAERFDPRAPSSFVRPASAPRLARALLSFGARNTGDLLGFARDTITGNSVSRIPKPRVVMAVKPDRILFVENDAIAWQSGWGEPAQRDTRDVPIGGAPAVAAFDGPRIAAARWFAGENRAFVPPDVLALQGIAGGTGVAIVVDEYNAPGPGAKHGVLVRGDGVVGDDGWVDVTPRREVAWDGTTMQR